MVLRVRRLGTLAYEEALALQRALALKARDDYLLVVEHPHVYTLGRSADPAHVLVDPASVGAAAVATDRGGDVTYHGPGQVVLYPLVTVEDSPAAGPAHVARLEEVVIAALEDLGVGSRCGGVGTLWGYRGVWLGTHAGQPRKVAAVGVRTLRAPGRPGRRTMHGVALNVDCDLSMFSHIVPCGIDDLPVTSLAAEGLHLRPREVADALVERAVQAWARGGEVEHQEASGRVPAASRLEVPPEAGEESRAVSVRGVAPPTRRRLRQVGVDPEAVVAFGERKPPWLRAPVAMGERYVALGRNLHRRGLVTVCEEAGCPNIYECWGEGTATFMINGRRCTRSCGFCLVDSRRPVPLDPGEPERVAEAVEEMGLAHAVVTCVARDDLSDGGAAAMAKTVAAIRRRCPTTAVEVLVSDYKGEATSLGKVLDARPDVFNHNLETVARLQRLVRPSAGYGRSLAVLARAAEAGLLTKSGLMVGLGESEAEVVGAMADLAAVGVRIVTVGQYLRPSERHLPVARFWRPEEFEALAEAGRSLGLDHIEASPLTRSSYHARASVRSLGGDD